MNQSVVRIERAGKSFLGERALDDVSIEVRARETVGIVGENGAGKSTLLKLMAGVCQPDVGHITVRGRQVRFDSVQDAAHAGIGVVFQEQSLLPNLSVAENIMLGHEDAALHAGFYDWKRFHALASAQLAKLGSDIPASAMTGTLSFAQRQVVELARAMAVEERTRDEPVILLDEPSSMLDAAQAEGVLALIERLRDRASVVFVSHRLDEVLRVCDRVYVMAGGRCVAERDRAHCSTSELRQLMLKGVHPRSRRPATRRPSGCPVRLQVNDLTRAGHYRAVSFDVRAGEVLGLAGAAGSGRESLARALFGAEATDSGEIVIEGRPVRFSEPADAVRMGIAYVPAERCTEGIVPGLSVRHNMTLAHLGDLRRGPVLDLRHEERLVRGWIDRLRIKPANPRNPVQALSGGNQQKVVLAKWLIARQPRLLILDHPFRGLDVAAREEMAATIAELAGGGVAIVLIADTVEELLTLCDSLIVMKNGAIANRFAAGAAQPCELRVLESML